VKAPRSLLSAVHVRHSGARMVLTRPVLRHAFTSTSSPRSLTSVLAVGWLARFS
jgi:hypothetical protein